MISEYNESKNSIRLLTPQNTMDVVLEAIQEVIPYELAVILSKEIDNKLKVRFTKGTVDQTKLSDYEIKLDERPDLAKVLNIGSVRLVDEEAHENHLDTYDGIIELPAGHSCMLAPLTIKGETVGLMTLDHSQCDIFTPQRVHIAETLSKIISLALAQSLENDKLLSEKETLIYERSALISDMDTVINGLIGKSPAWLQIIEKIKLVAPTDSNVMILGETGTGKEQVAKAIHSLSNKSEMPFIALNCSALNINLAESELFGHEKGSFTGASSTRRGRFELADGGTLFLDEVGDLPLDIQPKLLRAIQEGTFERVGGEKTIKANVRIICATNVNLEEKVREGKFREDLFYRLNVFPITLPPLRKRKEDIVLLVNYFLEKLAERFNKSFIEIDHSALEKLRNHNWLGNVRELQNTLERAVILSKGGTIHHNNILFEEIKGNENNLENEANYQIDSFEEEVKKIISKALKLSNGKIYGEDGAASILKIKPTTLQSKMKKVGLA
jgi:transcriptional regulator with GAF, ATPase, and Fis domain